MKTYPATGSLNTEITDYDETRPIFTDMVSDLKKLVSKTNDLGMLPLECEYLNKTALAAVVGHQPVHEKHFTLKRKPKSNSLRAELLQKSVDAQSSLKKTSAPTVPLRSRGIPRKMTDTTPLKGIPSRVPTSGFRWVTNFSYLKLSINRFYPYFRSPPSSTSTTRPSMSRTTPAGRKDGGIKLLEIEDQPLGYAATKKRKRQQEIEEQAKKTVETGGAAGAVSENNTNTANDSSAASTPTTPTITTPDYAAGLTASIVYSQPPTPMPPAQAEIPAISTATSVSSIPASAASESPPAVVQIVKVKEPKTPKRQKLDNAEIKSTEMKSPDSKNVILVKKEVKQEPKLVKVARNQLPTLITAQSPVKSMVNIICPFPYYI